MNIIYMSDFKYIELSVEIENPQWMFCFAFLFIFLVVLIFFSVLFSLLTLKFHSIAIDDVSIVVY